MRTKHWIFIAIAIALVVIAFFMVHKARKAMFISENKVTAIADSLAQAKREKNEAVYALEECEKKVAEQVVVPAADTATVAVTPPVTAAPPAPASSDLQKEIAELKELARRLAQAKAQKQEVVVKVVHENVPPIQKPDAIQTAPAAEVVKPVEVKKTSSFKLPSYFYEDASGAKWCSRLGGNEGRHLPHLAISDGIIGEENGISGFNWLETELCEKIEGDRGLTTTGTFFVIKSFIDKYMIQSDRGIVEIKAPATGWQPKKMTIERHNGVDYYVYKAMK